MAHLRRTVIFIGDHGSGKSTLCNLLIQNTVFYKRDKRNNIVYTNRSTLSILKNVVCNDFAVGDDSTSFTKEIKSSFKGANWIPYDTPGVADLLPNDRELGRFQNRIQKVTQRLKFDIICMVIRHSKTINLEGPSDQVDQVLNKYINLLNLFIPYFMQNRICIIVTGETLNDIEIKQVQEFYQRGLRKHREANSNTLNPNGLPKEEDYPICYISGAVNNTMSEEEIRTIYQTMCVNLNSFLNDCNVMFNKAPKRTPSF
jgi:GTPase SAR1 family protein